jgi:hypothetical protein
MNYPGFLYETFNIIFQGVVKCRHGEVSLTAALCLLFSSPFFANGTVDVNITWVKHTETLQSMSIAPRGTVSNPYVPPFGDGRGVKCTYCSGLVKVDTPLSGDFIFVW